MAVIAASSIKVEFLNAKLLVLDIFMLIMQWKNDICVFILGEK